MVAATSCEAPPPPLAICDPITQEQNDAVTIGMPIGNVQVMLGKRLTLTQQAVLDLSTGRVTFETWTWEQDSATSTCFQYVSYSTENNLVTHKMWMAAVK